IQAPTWRVERGSVVATKAFKASSCTALKKLALRHVLLAAHDCTLHQFPVHWKGGDIAANPRQRTGSPSECELFHQISRMHPLQRLSHRPENQMDREQLEQVRKSVDAQLRWPMLHDGDQELLEVLLI